MKQKDRVVWCKEYFHPRPLLFKEVTDGDLKTCTVTSTRYLDMLTHYAIPELQRKKALSAVLWMQDGDPPHVGSSVPISRQWISVCGAM